MVKKIFCIMSNSGTHLTADIVAEALLKQITLSSSKPKVVFGVIEVPQDDKRQQSPSRRLSPTCL